MTQSPERDLPNIVAKPKKRIFEQVVDEIKGLMRSGHVKPGDRLLAERDLADRLQVSRATVREALRSLENIGLLSIVPGQGAFVENPNARSLGTFFSLMLSLQPALSENLLEVRIALECEAVRLACSRATSEELYVVKEALERMARARQASDLGAQADFDFHKAIIHAAHNQVLWFMYEAIEDLLHRSHYERRVAVFNKPRGLEMLVDCHREVHEALIQRDEDLAETSMRDHFFVVQRQFDSLNL